MEVFMAANKRNRIADNVTIDLFDYLWNLVAQWKAILVFALIISLLTMVATYAKEMRAYNNTDVQTVTIESLRDGMGEEEYVTVQYGVRQKLLLEKYPAYLDNSPLQDIDPTCEHVLKSTYVVQGADDMTTVSLVDLYNGFFLSDSFIQGISEMIPEEEAQKYASALIVPGAVAATATDEKETTVGSRVFAVTVILIDGMDADTVANYVETQVRDYTATATAALGTHEVTLVSQDETDLVNIELTAQMKDIMDYSYTIRNSVQSITQNFSENQKHLYDLMLEEVHSDGTAEEASMTIAPTHPTLSKRSLVLGFAVGVLLYVFAYLVYSLFQKHIRTAKECEDTLEIRTLGELHQFCVKGWRVLFASKLFYGLKYRRYADMELQKEKIVDSLVAYNQKNPGSKVQLVSVAKLSETEKQRMEEILAEAKANGVDVSLLVGDVNRDTSFHQNLAKAQQMVLILCKNRTTYEDIDLCLNLARESQVAVLGSVFADC